MKKFLKLNMLSLFSLSFLGTFSNSINTNMIKNDLVDGVWEKVYLKHTINTSATGTHSVDDTKTDTWSANAIEWETILSKNDKIKVIGSFKLGTYKKPKSTSSYQLLKNDDLSDSTTRVWTVYDENDIWSGWAHQTSTITIKVVAKYDKINSIIGITLISYIYARTAGAVHQCMTYSEIIKINFNN